MIGRTIIAVLASVLIAHADPVTDKLATAGVAEFSAAYQAWDGTRFATAAEIFRQAIAHSPDAALPHYWRGAALFHQMLQISSTPEQVKLDDVAAAAIAELESAVKLDAGNAEAHAMLGTLYGMKIKGSLLRALRFGPAVQEHQKLAMQHGPENPRVRYLLGTGLFHTAKDAADTKEALDTLLAAEKLFEAEAKLPAPPLAPRWGYSSCLTFAARAYEALGKNAEAVQYFKNALAAHPADHVAQDGLKRLNGL